LTNFDLLPLNRHFEYYYCFYYYYYYYYYFYYYCSILPLLYCVSAT